MWVTNLKVLVLTLVVVAFYTMVARIIPQLESDVPEALDLGADVTPEALVAAGERIYNGAGGCTVCHGLGTRAPNLLTAHGQEGTIGARCGSRTEVDCKAYLYASMTDPGAYVVSGFENIMQDTRRQLSEDQIWAVIAFLQSQGGEVTVTAADLTSEAATAGVAGAGVTTTAAATPERTTTTDPLALLQEKTCLVCHQIDGAGPPIGPSFDGIGTRLEPDEIRRSILDPNADIAEGFEQFAGTMPANFGEQLSAAQLEAIVRFLAGRK